MNSLEEKIFENTSKTYAVVKISIAELIKKKYGYEPNVTICGIRIRPQDEWRICAYWEAGRFHRERIGKITDVVKHLGL